MKVEFDTVLLDLKNNPIKDGNDNLTLGGVACAAMLAVMQSDQTMPSSDKMRMFRLAQKASNGGTQNLTAEDITLLKERVGSLYSALIVGRVFDALENIDGKLRSV